MSHKTKILNLFLAISFLEELIVEVEIEVKLRPTARRPVRLGVRPLSRTLDQFFFLLEILFYFVAPSLTRGRVCNLPLMLVLASAVPRDSRPYFIVPILETPPTWRDRFPYLYPPGTGWSRYTPQALGSLSVAFYDSQGLRWRYDTHTKFDVHQG
jgi:hypothetical protein